MRVTEHDEKNALTFARLALALANDYESVYVIRIEDDSYVEYAAEGEDKTLYQRSEGKNFYADTQINCRLLVFEEDQEHFLYMLDKTRLLDAVTQEASFTMHYRLVIGGKVLYYSLKAVRGTGIDDRYIMLGIRNIDTETRRRMAEEAEKETFGEIAMALAQRYEVIYRVNIGDNSYTEYSKSAEYAQQGRVNTGDFFADSQENMRAAIFADDLPMMQHAMQKHVLLSHMQETGTTALSYRLLLDGRPQYVTLFAIRPAEDSQHIIVAVANVDAAKRRELDFRAQLGTAMDMAQHDALTGVKNKHAYAIAEDALDRRITEESVTDFAVVVCDVNGLKAVNDTYGHSAGDAYIRDACRLICNIFKHSPVFRIGGDEFAVLLEGQDLENSAALMAALAETVEANRQQQLVTVAGGISYFQSGKDGRTQDVFERADRAMYHCKREFKHRKHT